VELAQKHERIYLETSGNTYFFIEYAVRKLGSHKVIFGSDFPHEHPLVQVRAIELLNLPQSDKDLILAGNILELLSPIS
jgi:predicted TIM-barrel fold metal-dependent hydrolase